MPVVLALGIDRELSCCQHHACEVWSCGACLVLVLVLVLCGLVLLPVLVVQQWDYQQQARLS